MAGEKLKIIRKKKILPGITLAPDVVQDSGGIPLPGTDGLGQGSATFVPKSNNMKVPDLPSQSAPALTTIQTDPVIPLPDRSYKTEEPPVLAGLSSQTVINAERALDPQLDDFYDHDIAISKKEARRVRNEEESAVKKRIREGQLQAIEYLKKYFGGAGMSNFGPGAVSNSSAADTTDSTIPNPVDSDSGAGIGDSAPPPPQAGSGENFNTPAPPQAGSGESFNTPPPPDDSFFPEIKYPSLPGLKPPHTKPKPKPEITIPRPPEADRRRSEFVGVDSGQGVWDIIFGTLPRRRDDL